MPISLNQANKTAVWDFWQKLNHVGAENVAEVIRAAVHEDVNWNGLGTDRPALGRRCTHLRFLGTLAQFVSRPETNAIYLSWRHRRR